MTKEALDTTDKEPRTAFQAVVKFLKTLFFRFTLPALLFVFVMGMSAIFIYIQDQQTKLIHKFEEQEVALYNIIKKEGADEHPVVLTRHIFTDMERNLESTFIMLTGSLIFYFIILSLIIRKLKRNSVELEYFVTRLKEMNGELHDEISKRDKMSVKLKLLNEELKHQSLHDDLTDLSNRRLFEDRLNLCINASKRNHTTFAVVILGLDGFKLINDTLGHDAGDTLLKEVSKRLSDMIREMDTVARLGGDEFAAILTDLDSPESAAIICERILMSVRKKMLLKNEEVNISASIGVSIYPQDGVTPQVLLKNADIAMHQAKSSGRGKFQFYRESMNAAGSRELKLRSKLQEAMDQSLLEMRYQPIVDVKAYEIISFEALLRWHDPDLGDISPVEIIKIANHLGLSGELSDWISESICKQIFDWSAQGFEVPKVSMNVTSFDLHSKKFIDGLEERINRFDIPGDKLVLEVTESTLASNASEIYSVLSRLNRSNIKIVIDDFGTGYSSLGYLHKLPIQMLKIDRSFIAELEQDKRNTSVIEIILSVGKALGIEIIAEGVETKSQLDILLKLGCSKMQGFLFSEALKASDCMQKTISIK